MAQDDLLLTVATVFPCALAAIGLGFVWWVSRASLPADLEADVLAALSDLEALPVGEICRRPPLAESGVDPATVRFVLEHLRRSGRAVRWYAATDARGQRHPMYRRVARPRSVAA
jgi:hypothetical protein